MWKGRFDLDATLSTFLVSSPNLKSQESLIRSYTANTAFRIYMRIWSHFILSSNSRY